MRDRRARPRRHPPPRAGDRRRRARQGRRCTSRGHATRLAIRRRSARVWRWITRVPGARQVDPPTAPFCVESARKTRRRRRHTHCLTECMRPSRFLGTLGLALGSALLFACGAPSDDASETSAEAALTEGALIQENSPYFWTTSRSMSSARQPRASHRRAPCYRRSPRTTRSRSGSRRGSIASTPSSVRPSKQSSVRRSPRRSRWRGSSSRARRSMRGSAAFPPASVRRSERARRTRRISRERASSGTCPRPHFQVTCLKQPAWTAAGAVKFWD